jgi:hypothetical protein
MSDFDDIMVSAYGLTNQLIKDGESVMSDAYCTFTGEPLAPTVTAKQMAPGIRMASQLLALSRELESALELINFDRLANPEYDDEDLVTAALIDTFGKSIDGIEKTVELVADSARNKGRDIAKFLSRVYW